MLTTLVATTRVVYSGAVNETMTFGMTGSEYVIKDIDGLGPVKTDLSKYTNVIDPGSTILSARDQERNIVIKFGFEPDYAAASDISSLRRELYSVFMPGSIVELTLTDDVLGVFTITGRVETHDPTIFAKEPEVQVSIICADPYFKKVGATVVEILPIAESFVLTYTGTAPTGIIFEFDSTVAGSNGFALDVNPVANSLFADRMSVDYTSAVGDHVLMSSVKGSREAKYIRSAVEYNAIPYFFGSLVKPKLLPGINHFDFFGYAEVDNAKITYDTLYGGL